MSDGFDWIGRIGWLRLTDVTPRVSLQSNANKDVTYRGVGGLLLGSHNFDIFTIRLGQDLLSPICVGGRP